MQDEALQQIFERFDRVEQGIRDIDKKIDMIAARMKRDSDDIGLVAVSVRALCELRGLDEHAKALTEAIKQRFPSKASDWDEITAKPGASEIPEGQTPQ